MSWRPDSKVFGTGDRKNLKRKGMKAAGETAIQEHTRKTETHQHLDGIIAQAAELTCKQNVVQLSFKRYVFLPLILGLVQLVPPG